MSINDRVKAVRGTLGLTQIEFGEKTGISQGHLTSIENGKRAVTEKTLKVICATFNVNEDWMRTGEGEMFAESDNVLLSQLAKKYNLDSFSLKFIETYIKLPQDYRKVISGFARSLADEISVDLVPEVSIGGNVVADQEIAHELSNYAYELAAEKGAKEKLLVSPDTKEA